MKAAYRRLLIKLSGGQLAGENGFGISPTVIAQTAIEVRQVHELGIQVCVVVGGGNIIRGIAAADEGMGRASADYMGMMASVINALALQDSLEKVGVDTRVQSALEIQSVAEPYIRRRAIRHLEKGRVVVFAGGTGNHNLSGICKTPGNEDDLLLRGFHITDPDRTHHLDIVLQQLNGALRHVVEDLFLYDFIRAFQCDLEGICGDSLEQRLHVPILKLPKIVEYEHQILDLLAE